MVAILKKEFKNYFKTPIAYVFLAPFIFLASMQFYAIMLYSTQASVDYILNYVNVLCLFIVPVLTMQLLSEEKAKKTDQLLITAPVNVWDIVLGKFFAAYGVFGVGCIITFIYPVIFSVIGSPIMSEVVGQYIGFMLIWGVFIAIGLFVSSCTESQVVSAILTFVLLFFVYQLDSWTASISNAVVKEIVSWFSVMSRYAEFQSGLLNLPNVIYYLSFIGVFLFLAKRNIETRRYR